MSVDAFRAPAIFGPAVPPREDAPAHVLLAFLGRDVSLAEAAV
jgi:hypothetical protein